MHRGHWLKQKMKDLGFTMANMAEELDINAATVWRWLENEKLPMVKVRMMAQVMEIDLEKEFPEEIEEKKDYEKLYLKELERTRILEEQLAEYKAKEAAEPGQNRDSED